MEQNEKLAALEALLNPEDGRVTTLANAAAYLFDVTPNINWLGFYFLSGGELKLGPFIGRPACTRIAPGKGVCGAALNANRLFNVPNVHEFPGHIACDEASLSELVIPMWAPDGTKLGVLDIDSPEEDRFTCEDEEFFTEAAKIVAKKVFGPPAGERLSQRTFLDYLSVAERLKSEARHCFTAGGIRETVAGHSWRMALMAMLLEPEFPTMDMEKVMRMCLIHDLGEAVTGDIPTFSKTEADEEFEYRKLMEYTDMLPGEQRRVMKELYSEMERKETPEAKFFKCLDRLEAVMQHNESDTATWTAIEYELNLHYGIKDAAAFPWMAVLREEMLKDTKQKIAEAEAAGLSPAPAALFDK